MGHTKKRCANGSQNVERIKEFVKNTAIIVGLLIIYIFFEILLYRLKGL